MLSPPPLTPSGWHVPTQVDKPLTPFLRNNKMFGNPPNKGARIPGYQGFIRGSQHFYGSTYGEMTRNASEHDFGTTFYGSPVEEQPNMVSHPFQVQVVASYMCA